MPAPHAAEAWAAHPPLLPWGTRCSPGGPHPPSTRHPSLRLHLSFVPACPPARPAGSSMNATRSTCAASCAPATACAWAARRWGVSRAVEGHGHHCPPACPGCLQPAAGPTLPALAAAPFPLPLTRPPPPPPPTHTCLAPCGLAGEEGADHQPRGPHQRRVHHERRGRTRRHHAGAV